MKKIQTLIQLLLAFNPIVKKDGDYIKNNLEKLRRQGIIIDKLRKYAKQEGTLLGRIISFPAKDGKCLYVITKVYTKTVQIDWLNYCNGWSDARCGHQALLDIDYARAFINLEDHCSGTLSKPRIICPTATASPERIKEFTA